MSSPSAIPVETKRHRAPSLDATLVTSVPLSSFAQHLTFQVEEAENGGAGDGVQNKARLKFLPGQSVHIEVALNGRPTPFAYSIASPPNEDNRFEICLKGVSKGSPADSLRELKEGTQVRVTHPQGNFVLQQPVGDAIFLAAGTGIAPIRSMVHWLMRSGNHQGSRVWLFFGARDHESLFFDHEFSELARKHSNFHYLPTLSRAHEEWPGARGHVQEHFLRMGPWTNPMHAYLCGPPAMVNDVRKSLSEQGWPDGLVHFDRHEF
jgi:ferredoxin-NADP reductase